MYWTNTFSLLVSVCMCVLGVCLELARRGGLVLLLAGAVCALAEGCAHWLGKQFPLNTPFSVAHRQCACWRGLLFEDCSPIWKSNLPKANDSRTPPLVERAMRAKKVTEHGNLSRFVALQSNRPVDPDVSPVGLNR